MNSQHEGVVVVVGRSSKKQEVTRTRRSPSPKSKKECVLVVHHSMQHGPRRRSLLNQNCASCSFLSSHSHYHADGITDHSPTTIIMMCSCSWGWWGCCAPLFLHLLLRQSHLLLNHLLCWTSLLPYLLSTSAPPPHLLHLGAPISAPLPLLGCKLLQYYWCYCIVIFLLCPAW